MLKKVNVEEFGFTSKNLKVGDEIAIYSYEECFDKWVEYCPDAEMEFVYATITDLWPEGVGFGILIKKDGKEQEMQLPFDWLEDVTVRTELF